MLFQTLVITFLISISPFGEARIGIPYAMLNNIHYLAALGIGVAGNILVYPLLMWIIDRFNYRLWPNPAYKKSVIRLSKIARRTAGTKVEKYGFWGLMIFVMVPFPGTGAYMGTIAATLFKIRRRQAFLAISLGLLISSIFMAVGLHLGSLGFSLFN